MKILIRRLSGPYGKLAPVDVLFDGWRVAVLKEGEEQTLERDRVMKIQVRMQSTCSDVYIPKATARDLYLECGSDGWPLLDFLTPPGISSSKLYLREIKPRWSK